MKNFELRRDRYEVFRQFDNPLLNISLTLALPDFRPFCKQRQLPPFHFFLYCVLSAIETIDNFLYRIHDDEVIKIDDIIGSFTVINGDNNLNFARFVRSADLHEFVKRSVRAGREAQQSRALINTSADLTPRQAKDNIYITCMPWIEMGAIEHPIFCHRTADIPSLAWGKFSAPAGQTMTLPLSVQAHHGFVDGFHVHLLAQAIASRVAEVMAAHA
ncbi:MAG TPA: CatA-like O-acetyltransferase [Telluria sp.]